MKGLGGTSGGGGDSYMHSDYHSTYKAGLLINKPPLVFLHTWHRLIDTQAHAIAAFICAGQHREDENACNHVQPNLH